MTRIWITAGLVAGMVAAGAPGAAAAPHDQPEREVLRFLDITRPIGDDDPGTHHRGDVLEFDNLLRHVDRSDAITRQVLGRFPSTCTPAGGTDFRCEGTLVLRDGTIGVTGTPDLSTSAIDMVVTGGTGRYASATGTARLTPTDAPGSSVLEVSLVRHAT